MAGFLDDAADSGLLSGLVGMGSGFIKGMENAEDRKYKRMEFEAKQKATDWEKEKKQLEAQQDKTKQNFDRAGKLRDDWLANQTTKKSQILGQNYKTLQSAAKDRTGAGDLTLIYSYMKMIEPTSAVLPGEYASAADTTGVNGKLWGMYNKIKDGQKLNEEQRQNFARMASKMYANQRQEQGQFDDQFGGLAETYGIPRNEVVLRIFEDPQTGEQRVVPVPASTPDIQGPAPESPGLVSKPKGLVKKPIGKKAAPANGAPDFDNMSEEELRKYLGQ